MNSIKFYLKIVPDQILWILSLIAARFIKRNNNDSVLIIPAADLNGGFGEDIMISSLISNFCAGKEVTIMTSNIIKRDEFLGSNKRISYHGGFKELNYFTMLNVLQKHREIYVIGADIMDGTYGYFPTIARLRVLKLAKMMGLEPKFTGFSVSNRMLPSIRKAMLKTSEFVKVKARDIDSYDRLKGFIEPSNLVLTNDIAFICPDEPMTYSSDKFEGYKLWCQNQKGRRIIGVCPNSIQANKIGLKVYIEGFRLLLEEFIKNGDFSFVFLFHDLRPLCGQENDRTISGKLYTYFEERGVDCFFPQNITNGVELKGYLGLVDFTVTGRMHLGISGAVVEKPMFGVCYANKFEGMLKLFDINPGNNLIDYTALAGCSEIVPLFLDNLGECKTNIIKYLPRVREQSLLNGSV